MSESAVPENFPKPLTTAQRVKWAILLVFLAGVIAASVIAADYFSPHRTATASSIPA